MSSSRTKARASEIGSIKLSPRQDGLLLQDTNVLYTPSEVAWMVKRIGNQERILKECKKDPVKLLDTVELLLQEQGASHAGADRSSESLFYYQLAVYLNNLKGNLKKVIDPGHKKSKG